MKKISDDSKVANDEQSKIGKQEEGKLRGRTITDQKIPKSYKTFGKEDSAIIPVKKILINNSRESFGDKSIETGKVTKMTPSLKRKIANIVVEEDFERPLKLRKLSTNIDAKIEKKDFTDKSSSSAYDIKVNAIVSSHELSLSEKIQALVNLELISKELSFSDGELSIDGRTLKAVFDEIRGKFNSELAKNISRIVTEKISLVDEAQSKIKKSCETHLENRLWKLQVDSSVPYSEVKERQLNDRLFGKHASLHSVEKIKKTLKNEFNEISENIKESFDIKSEDINGIFDKINKRDVVVFCDDFEKCVQASKSTFNSILDVKLGTSELFEVKKGRHTLENENRQIGFINGMDTEASVALKHARMLSKISGNVEIKGVYNATHGPTVDVIECEMGLGYIATPPVRLLHEKWDKHFDKCEEKGKLDKSRFLEICHSQGAIHVRNALLSYNPNRRKHIEVLAIAPGTLIDNSICERVRHYRTSSAWSDVVPRISTVKDSLSGSINSQNIEKQGSIIELESLTKGTWKIGLVSEHSFDDEIYQKSITKELGSYIKGGR